MDIQGPLEDRAKELLKYDGLAEAEKLTGVSYKEDDATMWSGLFLSINNNEMKRQALSALGDTHYGISWAAFKQLLISHGFEEITARRFEYTSDEGILYPELVIYAHRDKKLLIHATSFMFGPNDEEHIINGGTLHGAIRYPGKIGTDKHTCLSGCSSGPLKGDILPFSKDVREGLFLTLKSIEDASYEYVSWNNPDTFLWLLDYVESKQKLEREPYGQEMWRKRRDEFIASAPDWVRAFIIGKERA